MGRVSRYKKIKACDPFAKKSSHVKVDTTHDLPPDAAPVTKKRRRRELDWDNDNDREILLQQDAKKLLREKGDNQEQAPQTKKLEGKRPNETMKEFLIRIRQETRKALVEQQKKISSTAQKRKEFLKEKKKNKKLKKLRLPDDSNDIERYEDASDKNAKLVVYDGNSNSSKNISIPADTVKFGERVDRPPDLSEFTEKLNRNKEKSLKRQSEDNSHAEETFAKPSKAAKKRSFDSMIGENSSDEYTTRNDARLHAQRIIYGTGKDMNGNKNGNNLAEMERLRSQVQEAYKALKAKRIKESENKASQRKM